MISGLLREVAENCTLLCCYHYSLSNDPEERSSLTSYVKGKAVPLQAWGGPEGSRKLRFPDVLTTAQDGGKFVSLALRPHLPQKILPALICVRG
jgi:hypothetical protein